MPREWPMLANAVIAEIAERIGAPLDPRTEIGGNNVEKNVLGMTMREAADYIAAIEGGNWTITDAGYLYLVPLVSPSEEDAPEISAHNADNLYVSEPLEPWSGVRVVWDGEEWDAQDPELGDETLVVVKKGDEIGFAGDESGRVLTVKVAFGQIVTDNPSHMWDRGAQRILTQISGGEYYPFEAQNVVLDPAYEIGDAVSLPDGALSMIYGQSIEFDGLCAADVSAPPDEAINTAYPANWQKQSSGARVTSADVAQIVDEAWNS